MSKTSVNSFWCMKCGRQGIPLARSQAMQREKFHKKRLYCLWCKREVNHVECKTPEEEREFQERFALGEFQEEAEESMRFIDEENYLDDLRP